MIINKHYNIYLYEYYNAYINILLYICSTKITLIIEFMTTEEENKEKILFKDYFESLDNPAKKEIRDKMVPIHMEYTTFYNKLKNSSWKELEIQELERLTGKSFLR